ncbi:hypothetical protein AOQ84DRAFT_367750, partial [Glonium stellatum]
MTRFLNNGTIEALPFVLYQHIVSQAAPMISCITTNITMAAEMAAEPAAEQAAVKKGHHFSRHPKLQGHSAAVGFRHRYPIAKLGITVTLVCFLVVAVCAFVYMEANKGLTTIAVQALKHPVPPRLDEETGYPL